MENVYVFKQTVTNIFKIGMTKKISVNDRLSSFKTYSPYPIEVITIIETENAYELERKLHHKFKDKRLSGEFFNLNEQDIEYIKNYHQSELLKTINIVTEFIIKTNINHKKIKDFIIKESKAIEYYENKIPVDSIIECVQQNFKDLFFTCMELQEKLMSNYDLYLTNKELGSFLASKYLRKCKKINNSPRWGYLENKLPKK